MENHYTWDELVEKRIEPQHWGGNRDYDQGCAFFSLNHTKKNSRTDPATYALFHPFTCFWVYFICNTNEKSNSKLGIYEVDKEEFVGLLEKWGVSLEYKRW